MSLYGLPTVKVDVPETTAHVAKLGEITGKTRVLYSKLGEITGKTRVLPGGWFPVFWHLNKPLF